MLNNKVLICCKKLNKNSLYLRTHSKNQLYFVFCTYLLLLISVQDFISIGQCLTILDVTDGQAGGLTQVRKFYIEICLICGNQPLLF